MDLLTGLNTGVYQTLSSWKSLFFASQMPDIFQTPAKQKQIKYENKYSDIERKYDTPLNEKNILFPLLLKRWVK